jgi:hypothetical protein
MEHSLKYCIYSRFVPNFCEFIGLFILLILKFELQNSGWIQVIVEQEV